MLDNEIIGSIGKLTALWLLMSASANVVFLDCSTVKRAILVTLSYQNSYSKWSIKLNSTVVLGCALFEKECRNALMSRERINQMIANAELLYRMTNAVFSANCCTYHNCTRFIVVSNIVSSLLQSSTPTTQVDIQNL